MPRAKAWRKKGRVFVPACAISDFDYFISSGYDRARLTYGYTRHWSEEKSKLDEIFLAVGLNREEEIKWVGRALDDMKTSMNTSKQKPGPRQVLFAFGLCQDASMCPPDWLYDCLFDVFCPILEQHFGKYSSERIKYTRYLAVKVLKDSGSYTWAECYRRASEFLEHTPAAGSDDTMLKNYQVVRKALGDSKTALPYMNLRPLVQVGIEVDNPLAKGTKHIIYARPYGDYPIQSGGSYNKKNSPKQPIRNLKS